MKKCNASLTLIFLSVCWYERELRAQSTWPWLTITHLSVFILKKKKIIKEKRKKRRKNRKSMVMCGIITNDDDALLSIQFFSTIARKKKNFTFLYLYFPIVRSYEAILSTTVNLLQICRKFLKRITIDYDDLCRRIYYPK